MNLDIKYKSYVIDDFCDKEILRYMGCRELSGETEILLKECKDEVKSKLVYKVCYRKFGVTVTDNTCDFGLFKLCSENLALNLRGCKEAVLFAATIGADIDRIITKYSKISPAKGLIFQAIGAERIEALCDKFCAGIAAEFNTETKLRFSPGYGDLPIEAQRIIFDVLDCNRLLGLYLNQSLAMSPTKSVTAFVGLK